MPRDDMANEEVTIDVPVLRRAAMDFLARREHSRLELQLKLTRKYPDADRDLLAQVLDDLATEKLQSDDRFVESWVRYRKSRGFGYRHISADLHARGISQCVLDRHLFADDEDWQALADSLVERKLGTGRLQFGDRQHRRLLRFLESRGFGAREIRNSLAKHLVGKQGE